MPLLPVTAQYWESVTEHVKNGDFSAALRLLRERHSVTDLAQSKGLHHAAVAEVVPEALGASAIEELLFSILEQELPTQASEAREELVRYILQDNSFWEGYVDANQDEQSPKDDMLQEAFSTTFGDTNVSLLQYAARTGDLELCQMIYNISDDIEVDERGSGTGTEEETLYRNNDGKNALHYAAYSGNLELLKFFLREYEITSENAKDHSYLAPDGSNTTMLYYAALSGNQDMVEQLIDWGFEADDSTLFAAANSGNTELVNYLIVTERCNPFAKNNNGSTVLHYAARSGNPRLIDMLTGEPYNLSIDSTNIDDWTPLDAYLNRAMTSPQAALKFLPEMADVFLYLIGEDGKVGGKEVDASGFNFNDDTNFFHSVIDAVRGVKGAAQQKKSLEDLAKMLQTLGSWGYIPDTGEAYKVNEDDEHSQTTLALFSQIPFLSEYPETAGKAFAALVASCESIETVDLAFLKSLKNKGEGRFSTFLLSAIEELSADEVGRGKISQLVENLEKVFPATKIAPRAAVEGIHAKGSFNLLSCAPTSDQTGSLFNALVSRVKELSEQIAASNEIDAELDAKTGALVNASMTLIDKELQDLLEGQGGQGLTAFFDYVDHLLSKVVEDNKDMAGRMLQTIAQNIINEEQYLQVEVTRFFAGVIGKRVFECKSPQIVELFLKQYPDLRLPQGYKMSVDELRSKVGAQKLGVLVKYGYITPLDAYNQLNNALTGNAASKSTRVADFLGTLNDEQRIEFMTLGLLSNNEDMSKVLDAAYHKLSNKEAMYPFYQQVKPIADVSDQQTKHFRVRALFRDADLPIRFKALLGKAVASWHEKDTNITEETVKEWFGNQLLSQDDLLYCLVPTGQAEVVNKAITKQINLSPIQRKELFENFITDPQTTLSMKRVLLLKSNKLLAIKTGIPKDVLAELKGLYLGAVHSITKRRADGQPSIPLLYALLEPNIRISTNDELWEATTFPGNQDQKVKLFSDLMELSDEELSQEKKKQLIKHIVKLTGISDPTELLEHPSLSATALKQLLTITQDMEGEIGKPELFVFDWDKTFTNHPTALSFNPLLMAMLPALEAQKAQGAERCIATNGYQTYFHLTIINQLKDYDGSEKTPEQVRTEITTAVQDIVGGFLDEALKRGLIPVAAHGNRQGIINAQVNGLLDQNGLNENDPAAFEANLAAFKENCTQVANYLIGDDPVTTYAYVNKPELVGEAGKKKGLLETKVAFTGYTGNLATDWPQEGNVITFEEKFSDRFDKVYIVGDGVDADMQMGANSRAHFTEADVQGVYVGKPIATDGSETPLSAIEGFEVLDLSDEGADIAIKASTFEGKIENNNHVGNNTATHLLRHLMASEAGMMR